MNEDLQQAIASARAGLRQNDTIVLGQQWYRVQTFLDAAAWRKRRKGFRAYNVFAEDDCGNEFLRGREGQVYFWDHQTGKVRQIGDSLFAFVKALGPQPEIELQPPPHPSPSRQAYRASLGS